MLATTPLNVTNWLGSFTAASECWAHAGTVKTRANANLSTSANLLRPNIFRLERVVKGRRACQALDGILVRWLARHRDARGAAVWEFTRESRSSTPPDKSLPDRWH